jgi:hypothetical protein
MVFSHDFPGTLKVDITEHFSNRNFVWVPCLPPPASFLWYPPSFHFACNIRTSKLTEFVIVSNGPPYHTHSALSSSLVQIVHTDTLSSLSMHLISSYLTYCRQHVSISQTYRRLHASFAEGTCLQDARSRAGWGNCVVRCSIIRHKQSCTGGIPCCLTPRDAVERDGSNCERDI